MDLQTKALALHKKLQGKLRISSKHPLTNKADLSLVYSPGVAEPCKEIQKSQETMYDYTWKGNTVAVISDGSAVLGLGNIGAKASLPVMEGKCVLFEQFAGLNAVPVLIDNQDTEAFIKTVENIAATYGGINLEDIAAPKCFEIEQRLKEGLDIPVMHDDQHGTAIVTLAGLINACQITGRSPQNSRVVINGVGAAGVAIAKLLEAYGFGNIVMVDSQGVIYKGREGLNPTKDMISNITNTACLLDPENPECIRGGLQDALHKADVFIGVSVAAALTKEMVKNMAKDPIIFALANPDPEIHPDNAKEAGAAVVATGRSDFPNQVNNVLAFPGVFKGALQNRVTDITDDMKLNAAKALAGMVIDPSPDMIIPDPFTPGVADEIAKNVI